VRAHAIAPVTDRILAWWHWAFARERVEDNRCRGPYSGFMCIHGIRLRDTCRWCP